MRRRRFRLADVTAVAFSAALALSCSQPAPPARTGSGPAPDIGYVPTPQNVVDKMLDVAEVKPTDVIYDLGCGDGRILVTAAKRYGARGVGFDIDPDRVAESRVNVRNAGVEDRVTIEQKNVFEVDLTPATVIALYLLPNLNVRLIPQLERLKPGSRVVSHDFDIDGVKPAGEWGVMAPKPSDPDKLREHKVFLWRAPIRREKGY
ncbi:MAG: methyltransferase domain-containing protein [Deltaproteobacteria bacterium]|nr:methyltransferase domain-containing protein [Deltaproteobacteria bacterium]